MKIYRVIISQLITVLGLISCCFLLSGCPSGKTSVVGATRSQLSLNEVEVYFMSPSNYEVIAIIEASDDTGWTPAGSEENAINKLKQQAAKVGANGVLLQRVDTNNSIVMGAPWVTKVAFGKAIYVHQNKISVEPASINQPITQATSASKSQDNSRETVPATSGSAPKYRKWKAPVE